MLPDGHRQINISVPKEIYDLLQKDADENFRSVRGQVRYIIRDYLERIANGTGQEG